VVFWASNRVEVINIADVWTELTVSSFTVRYAKDSTTDMEPHENRSPLEITNDVSDYMNVLVRIAHIICNHTLLCNSLCVMTVYWLKSKMFRAILEIQ
jgi:hypothetical protein